MTAQAEKSATNGIKELITKLSNISQLTAEAVACCQLSSFAVETTFDQLRTRLLAEQPRLRVYTALGGSLDSFASSFDASSLSMMFPKLEDVHENILQLEALLRRIIDHISRFPTLHDPSSGITTAEEQTDDVFAILDEETRTLSQYFLSLSREFHDFWKERLMLHTGPSTATIPPSVVVARALQTLVSSVDHILTSSFEKYRSESYAPSSDACLQIISSLDSATNGVVSEMSAWATSHETTPIAQEVYGLICQYLWCSRLITDLAEVRAELKPEALPVTTAAGVVYALLQTQIVRSRVCDHLVVPIGASGSGKDSLINALIGITVLPPFGIQTAFPCRIKHQHGLTEPILTIPHRGFLAALNCLRKAQLSKRRAALDTMKDQSMADPATRGLIKKFKALDKGAVEFINKLESTDYDIPETLKGVVPIRQLLGDINTLGRACHSLGIPFNFACLEWPTVSVDFLSLHESPDSWEFWSVPGEYNAEALPGDFEYFNHSIEHHANVVPMLNYHQRIEDTEWTRFPSRLRSAQTTIPCVLVTWAEGIGIEALQGSQTAIGQEFLNDSNSPRVLICDLFRGPGASAFRRLFRGSGGKPPYTVISSDPGSFEYIYIARMAPNSHSLPAVYEACLSSELEESSARVLKKSQLDETLQGLVQWVPQSTRHSTIESVRLMGTRCSELEKAIDVILGSKILAALQQREQEDKIEALLAHMRIMTEANLEDAHQLLQVFHERFATRIAEEVHLAILHCMENASPAPNQLTVEFLFSEMGLAQLMGRIDERLRGALDDLSKALAQDLDSALEPLIMRELSVLPTDLATALGIRVAPFHERLRLDSKKLPMPTLDEIKHHCDIFHPKGSVQTLFEDCRCKLPLIGKRRHRRIFSPITALLAIIPFLARWHELLHDTPPSYRTNITRLEQFYRDNLTTPWQNERRTVVDSSIENAVKEAQRAVEETRLKVNGNMAQDDLRLLLAAKGSIHFAVAMLPHLLGGAEAA